MIGLYDENKFEDIKANISSISELMNLFKEHNINNYEEVVSNLKSSTSCLAEFGGYSLYFEIEKFKNESIFITKIIKINSL